MIKLISTFVLVFTTIICNSQIKGSGKTSTKTYDYKNFDKVYFEDLDGNIEVEIGKTWSVTVTIDDNLESLLQFKENTSEHELKIQFKGNRKNRMYIEKTNTSIKVTLPEASVIKNAGNSDLVVKHILGRYFKLKNYGNGNVVVNVSEEITGKLIGNGDVINKGKAKFSSNSAKIGNGKLID